MRLSRTSRSPERTVAGAAPAFRDVRAVLPELAARQAPEELRSSFCLQCCWCLGCHNFGRRNCACACLVTGTCSSTAVSDGFTASAAGRAWAVRRRRRLRRRNNDGSRRTCYRLRRDESRRRLRRFHRSCGLRAGGNRGRRLCGAATRGTGPDSASSAEARPDAQVRQAELPSA